MNFGEALEVLKQGRSAVSRSGWDGKGMYVTLMQGESRRIGPDGPDGPFTEFKALVLMTTSKEYSTWNPIQEDLFAEDWKEIGWKEIVRMGAELVGFED